MADRRVEKTLFQFTTFRIKKRSRKDGENYRDSMNEDNNFDQGSLFVLKKRALADTINLDKARILMHSIF
jgi:hypothetical protein